MAMPPNAGKELAEALRTTHASENEVVKQEDWATLGMRLVVERSAHFMRRRGCPNSVGVVY